MKIIIVACGVFQPELSRLLPELQEEFKENTIEVIYLEMALHNDLHKLKESLHIALDNLTPKEDEQRIAVLYGSICHPEIRDFCAKAGAVLPTEKNCIDLYLSEEEKQSLSANNNTFFLTNGWFQNWRSSLAAGGWDTYDARMNFGRYDTFLLMDGQQTDYKDEELLDFYEYTTVPIEIEPLSLERFREEMRRLIAAALAGHPEKA